MFSQTRTDVFANTYGRVGNYVRTCLEVSPVRQKDAACRMEGFNVQDGGFQRAGCSVSAGWMVASIKLNGGRFGDRCALFVLKNIFFAIRFSMK